jgi:hypothetical protein
MNCYNHHSKVSVGFCKHCAKGLCVDCTHEIQNIGLACSNTYCIERIKINHQALDQSLQITKGFLKNRLIVPLFFVTFGLTFFLVSWLNQGNVDTLSLFFGSIFTVFGVVFGLANKLYSRKK